MITLVSESIKTPDIWFDNHTRKFKNALIQGQCHKDVNQIFAYFHNKPKEHRNRFRIFLSGQSFILPCTHMAVAWVTLQLDLPNRYRSEAVTFASQQFAEHVKSKGSRKEGNWNEILTFKNIPLNEAKDIFHCYMKYFLVAYESQMFL